MTPKIRAFVDSDVVISAMISKYGAAAWVVDHGAGQLFISDLSLDEIERVAKRLNISPNMVNRVVTRLQVATINPKKEVSKLVSYVHDADDSHILAGAIEAKARFLITYNQKHYVTDLIKNRFDIIVLRPALYLQYLRSIGKA